MIVAEVAVEYFDHGFAPVPLKPKTKIPVYKNVTGSEGRDLSRGSVSKIKDDCNLGLRMKPGVIGLDWDAYKGAEGFLNLIELLGELPETYRSTSRANDPHSGIYLYKTSAPITVGEIKDCNVELIKHNHRTAVCYPSVHDKSGRVYRWYWATPGLQDAVMLTRSSIPSDEFIPELPARWAQFLTEMGTFRKTGGTLSMGQSSKLASFTARVEEFAQMESGNRNNVMKDLARDGRWYELGGRLEDGQSLEMIIEAAVTNGLVADDSESTVVYRLMFSRTWAEKHFDPSKVGNPESSSFDREKLVAWNNNVQAAKLSPELKFAANVIVSFAVEKHYSYVVMSSRALAEVCGVSHVTAAGYMKKLEAKGWIKLTAGQGINHEGKPLRSNVVNFDFSQVTEAPEAPEAPLVGDVEQILEGYFAQARANQDTPPRGSLTNEPVVDMVVGKGETTSPATNEGEIFNEPSKRTEHHGCGTVRFGDVRTRGLLPAAYRKPDPEPVHLEHPEPESSYFRDLVAHHGASS